MKETLAKQLVASAKISQVAFDGGAEDEKRNLTAIKSVVFFAIKTRVRSQFNFQYKLVANEGHWRGVA